MKYLILPIFLLAFVSLSAQKYKCTYNVYYNFYYSKDTLNNSEYSKPTTFLLYGNEKHSVFKPLAMYILDSLVFNTSRDFSKVSTPEEGNRHLKQLYEMNLPPAYFNVTCIKELKDKKLHYHFACLEGVMACQSKMDIGWQHSQEKDTIAGIEVYKASARVGGRTWIAWYAPSIPVNDGPYKLSGLPGLIVKAYDDQKRYFFEMESIPPPGERVFRTNNSYQ